MADVVEANGDTGGELEGDISPKTSILTQPAPSLGTPNSGLGAIGIVNQEAQTTVSDFVDFTEYLPSGLVRSLTSIGTLDEAYAEASTNVSDLTTTWGQLPMLSGNERIPPVQLRKEISKNLQRAVSSRVSAYDEAVRVHENVKRHHNRILRIRAKLKVMLDNYPTAEEQQKSLVKSPQMVRAPKITLRVDDNGQRMQRQPRIIIPGEVLAPYVLAPYEVDFNAYSSLSDEDSEVEEEEEEIPAPPPRRVATPSTRIKVVKAPKPPKQKVPKAPRPPRTTSNRNSGNAVPMMSTSTALAQLKPPPDDAVPGSEDAPWLQLTPYEMARLRKRMKKNVNWVPSQTMIARELKLLGRGPEAYKAAKAKAEAEGKPFIDALPISVVDAESGAPRPPEGAMSAEALTADDVQLSNRGMKLNEAKKLKRESLARQAAEEAEESARKMEETARMLLGDEASPSVAGSVQDKLPETSQGPAQVQAATAGPASAQAPASGQGKTAGKSKARKRKRESMSETPITEKPEGAENSTQGQSASQSERPQLKRTKTETPVPLPQITPRPPSVPPPLSSSASVPITETPIPVPHVGKIPQAGSTSKTPVPAPAPVSSDNSGVTTRSAASSGATSPAPSSSITTTVPIKPPAETAVIPPIKTSTTPIPPPTRELPKRETRQNLQSAAGPTNAKQPGSRGNTPAATPVPEPQALPATPVPAQPAQPAQPAIRRPSSRGKAASQEPPSALAADRPRRASTARNTPAPELRQPSKRTKRPAPGVVTTNSGGTSAIGKRKAAPRKKARGGTKKERGASQQAEQEVEVEVDDDGNVIDPEEPRYCLCNRVSFGTMIQCDNVDVSATQTTASPASHGESSHHEKLTTTNLQNCKHEWFHLECVGLTEIPARTTKWYCPDCRVLLNIGGRGEVNSRGIKM
ncbi:hypothetical protein F4821DRAFT_225720 [Hypoxylon rubiginosum]|uniref:Uncharacterized protein n=1 Tax=Hypoxylon rubiginosum TaxID=110542 RepID=A0ACC0DGH9_9PEZI|nr:hypothetical protein F4821DRAFT_225720 [Hypoxylon rubiginosum]